MIIVAQRICQVHPGDALSSMDLSLSNKKHIVHSWMQPYFRAARWPSKRLQATCIGTRILRDNSHTPSMCNNFPIIFAVSFEKQACWSQAMDRTETVMFAWLQMGSIGTATSLRSCHKSPWKFCKDVPGWQKPVCTSWPSRVIDTARSWAKTSAPRMKVQAERPRFLPFLFPPLLYPTVVLCSYAFASFASSESHFATVAAAVQVLQPHCPSPKTLLSS